VYGLEERRNACVGTKMEERSNGISVSAMVVVWPVVQWVKQPSSLSSSFTFLLLSFWGDIESVRVSVHVIVAMGDCCHIHLNIYGGSGSGFLRRLVA